MAAHGRCSNVMRACWGESGRVISGEAVGHSVDGTCKGDKGGPKYGTGKLQLTLGSMEEVKYEVSSKVTLADVYQWWKKGE